MRPASLVDAALLDQERRLIAASPREFTRRPSAGKVKCAGGCGRMTCASQAPTGEYVCRPCRIARRRADPIDRVDVVDQVDKPELQNLGWTASRSPCGPDDVDAR